MTITGSPWIDLTIWAVTAVVIVALVLVVTWGDQQ